LRPLTGYDSPRYASPRFAIRRRWKHAIRFCQRTATAAWKALEQAASQQAAIQASAEPTQQFLDYLNAALMARKAHVAGKDGDAPPSSARWGWDDDAQGKPAPCGDRVGWLDGHSLYLDPEISLDVAKAMARDADDSLTVSNHALRKRLHEKGLLVSFESSRQRLTVRRTLDGVVRDVLHLETRSLGLLGT
jgi:hypothetical protein